jgi:2-polyprenyl-3-methyl-5-hydroxy-6-metoxy-1,4-benzoquinol methylase
MLEKSEIPERYDKIAGKYVERGSIPFYDTKDKVYSYIYKKNLEEILLLLGSFRNKKILDAGCGGGFYSIPVAMLSDQIYSLDVSSKNLEILKKRAESLSNVYIARGDIESLPYKSDFFDWILLLGVLEHLPNTRKAVEELQRVLAPEGKIICLVPNHDGVSWRINELKNRFKHKKGEHELSQPEYSLNFRYLIRIFEENNLNILDFFAFNFGLVLKCFEFVPKIEKLHPLCKKVEYAFNRSTAKSILGTDYIFILQKGN